MTQHVEGTFIGVGNTELYFQGWLPEAEPRAVMMIAHGVSEHSGRYRHVAEFLAAKGLAVYALDHRGHGRSEGRRCYVDRFRDFTDDLETFRELVRARHPAEKLFLLGHSLGGAISLAYALDHQEHLDGLILSGPAVTAGDGVPKYQLALARVLGRVAPRLGIVQLDSSTISRDPAVVAAYDADPLVFHGKAPARLGSETLATMARFPDAVASLRLPILIVHGDADALASVAGARLVAARAGSDDLTLKIYEGLFHEVMNEPERDEVLADIESWLAARAIAQQGARP